MTSQNTEITLDNDTVVTSASDIHLRHRDRLNGGINPRHHQMAPISPYCIPAKSTEIAALIWSIAVHICLRYCMPALLYVRRQRTVLSRYILGIGVYGYCTVICSRLEPQDHRKTADACSLQSAYLYQICLGPSVRTWQGRTVCSLRCILCSMIQGKQVEARR